jgi:hypothetical protein
LIEKRRRGSVEASLWTDSLCTKTLGPKYCTLRTDKEIAMLFFVSSVILIITVCQMEDSGKEKCIALSGSECRKSSLSI